MFATVHFLIQAIMFIVGPLLFEGICEAFSIFWKVLLAIIIISTVKLIIKCFKTENISDNICKQENVETKNQIKELAIQYIENRIKSSEDTLSFEDYKKFNNIVQMENNIKVSNDYNTEVPYQIREILYSVYLKKNRKLKK